MRTPVFYLFLFLLPVSVLSAQESQGSVVANTNLALPESYNFQEYAFAEPADQGNCTGSTNATATIAEVFLAQTHRHAIGHPFFFTIGYRPALFQVAVTGSGNSPDVQVEGELDGVPIGSLCLKGPAVLSETIDLATPNFEDYFSVTLPKDWVRPGLELKVIVGGQSRTITPAELKVGPYTEMNLVMVNMDVLDYNTEDPQYSVFDDFLEEVASAIPASVVRFGVFPEPLPFPELVASNDTEPLVRLSSRSQLNDNGIFNEGAINSVAVEFLANLHKSTNDYLSTVYFGNTLNLTPGGWGGGKSFVGFDYTDIFIHELGHALSLPHWESHFDITINNEFEYLYPYGGASGEDGGGRGSTWNFIQDSYEFVSPVCTEGENAGMERSDCMQRNFRCIEERPSGMGPWDGFGDFSAYAMHRYLVGADIAINGEVTDRGAAQDFQLNVQEGFPIVSLENGARAYNRDPVQRQETTYEEKLELVLPGEEQLNTDSYLIYGTIHETQAQANIVYKPVKFNGTLPPVIDPTSPAIFAQLQQTPANLLYDPRDITLKLTYVDGTVLHALNPYHSFFRAPYTDNLGIFRYDLCNFSLVVPGDKPLQKVELYKRPFCVRDENNDTEGNINYAPNGITAANFMDDAVYLTEYNFGTPAALGTNTIGNRVWHDLNQNGLLDNNEPGIPGVSLVLWRDSDGDGIPDGQGFGGVRITDEDGFYSFTGLGPGNYMVFVWEVDNWNSGEPLEGMVPTVPFTEDPNTDIDGDSQGRPGNINWGLAELSMVSGLITITADGEPLNDGDREDCWFDYDPSGNMTIDFGFFVEGAVVSTGEPVNQLAKIFPNPSSGYFQLETERFNGQTLSLVNTYGQTVLSTKLTAQQTRIDVSGLPAGVYVALLQDGSGKFNWSSKLVKMN